MHSALLLSLLSALVLAQGPRTEADAAWEREEWMLARHLYRAFAGISSTDSQARQLAELRAAECSLRARRWNEAAESYASLITVDLPAQLRAQALAQQGMLFATMPPWAYIKDGVTHHGEMV